MVVIGSLRAGTTKVGERLNKFQDEHPKPQSRRVQSYEQLRYFAKHSNLPQGCGGLFVCLSFLLKTRVENQHIYIYLL